MIGRVLEQSKALSQVLSEDKKTCHLVPTWQDMDVLKSINNALGPFQEFTDTLSGEAYVSVSYLKPVLHLLKTSTLAESDQDTDLTKELSTSLRIKRMTQSHRSSWSLLLSLISGTRSTT